MNVEHFLAWLPVADLNATGDAGLREIMEQVLDDAPGEDVPDLLGDFLDELEDQLDLAKLDRERITGWPNRFRGLLPAVPPASARLLQDSSSPAGAAAAPSPTLARFEACLGRLSAARDEAATRQAWAELEDLEVSMSSARAEFAAELEGLPVEAESAQRVMEEGFEHWFQAFDLAKVAQVEEALVAAREGNCLFRAVADWSAEVE